MDATIVYLDEDLPEIEIHELVSTQEKYEYSKEQKKGINVHSTSDLLLQLTMLLQSKMRAKGFLKLHQEILQEDLAFLNFSLPEVHLQRVDAGDEDAFYEALDEANKIDNYYTRTQEVHKTFLGFETTAEEEPRLHVDTPTQILLHSEPNTQSVLLPQDQLHPTIHTYRKRIGIPSTSPVFKSLTLVDQLSEYTQFSELETPIILELQDLYSLWKEFTRHGKTLDYTSLQMLQETLLQLKKKDKEIYTFLKSTASYRPNPIALEEIGGQAFYSIQRQIFLSIRPILELLKTNLLQLYQSFLEALSTNVTALQDTAPIYAYDLVQQLLEGRTSIQDTINQLQLRMLKEQQKTIQQWLSIVNSWDVATLEDKVEQNYSKYLQTSTSVKDEAYIPWSSINEHIKEVSKGEIISKTVEETYLPTLAETELLLEKDDPTEITLPIFEEPVEAVIPDTLSEGQKELFAITYKLLYSLHKASGLPLDLHKLTQQIPNQFRKTKLTIIQEQLPELTAELQIIASKLDEQQITEVIDIPSIRVTLHKIHKQFVTDLESQLSYLLAWWICDLQKHVLNRTLNFEIWKGSSNCIPVWSPYGLPMEPVKKKEGMIPYLQCVIADLVQFEGTTWSTYFSSGIDLFDKLQPLFDTFFVATVEELQTQFKSFDKELPIKNLKNKGLTIKEDLEAIVKKREKTKYLQEYMKFLNNLPSVLIQSSIAKRIYSGCCLQLLSDKYASDYDWSAYAKDAYKLKKLFATQKLEKEPLLAHYGKAVPLSEQTSTLISNAGYLTPPEIEKWVLDNWVASLETYMPFTEFSQLKQSVVPFIEKNLSIYSRAIKNTFKPFILETNLQTLMEFYRKIIQVQHKIIETDYKDLELEYTFLKKEFTLQEKLYTLLLSSTDYYTDVNELFRKRIVQYFISRQLCFPAKPEFAKNNSLVLIESDLESSVLDGFLQATYDEIVVWVKEKQFNQTTNFQEYIAKMREQENNSKLQIIDRMNPEERKLYIEAKKLGIAELQDYLGQFQENKKEVEQEGEEFVDYGENNDEMDMDNLYDDEV